MLINLLLIIDIGACSFLIPLLTGRKRPPLAQLNKWNKINFLTRLKLFNSFSPDLLLLFWYGKNEKRTQLKDFWGIWTSWTPLHPRVRCCASVGFNGWPLFASRGNMVFCIGAQVFFGYIRIVATVLSAYKRIENHGLYGTTKMHNFLFRFCPYFGTSASPVIQVR